MAKKTFGLRALALLMALLICCGSMNITAQAARDEDSGDWTYAYYLGQEYLGNAAGKSVKPDPVGYGFQGVITSITFTDDAGTKWTFNWSSEANGEWRITGKGASKEKASAWPQITDGKVYIGYCGGTAYTFTLSNDGSSESWTYARNGHANWFRYIRFIRKYTVNVFYQNETGTVSYQGVNYAQQDPITGSFTFYYPNGSIIDDSEYKDGEYTEPTTLWPEDYLPQSMIDQGYEIKYATDAEGKDVTQSGVTISLLGSNVLNVYCTLIPPATQIYTVRHRYYTDGQLDGTVDGGSVEVAKDSDFAAIVNGIEKLPQYEGNAYTYTRYDVDPAKKVITLVYNRVLPTYDYAVTYYPGYTGPQAVADSENVSGVKAVTKTIGIDDTPFQRENYIFLGWATEEGGAVAYKPGMELTFTAGGSQDLYAVWQMKPRYSYTLIYNGNGGITANGEQSYADAENVRDVFDVTKAMEVDGNLFARANHTFLGFNTKPDGSGTAYAEGETIILTADNNEIILYAQWEENPKYSYTLVYNANFGLEPQTAADAENVTGVYATEKALGVDGIMFDRPNYTFLGWNTEADGSGDAYAPGGEIVLTAEHNTEVLYAQWEENPKFDYALTYHANFGEEPATAADSENVSQVYETVKNLGVDANMFDRPNYTFLGWNTEADGTGDAYAPGDVIVLTAENNTEILYAQWEENPKFDYTVIYNANFGEIPETAADSENVLQVYDTQKTITVDENSFIRENFRFLGWATEPQGEVVYLPGDEILFIQGGSQILYAQWVELDKYSYTLVYNGNGGLLEDGSQTCADAENVRDVYALVRNFRVDDNAFIRNGHTFLGWNTEADGSGTAYAPEDVLVLTAQDNAKILYAQWEEKPKFDYTVIYNANFGEVPAIAADSENVLQTYQSAKIIDVDANPFLREHYTFLGWAETPEGAVAYQPGDSLKFIKGGSKELFAVWEINTYAFTVEYLTRIDGGEYVPFMGTLPEGTCTGGQKAYGAVVGMQEVNPPQVLEERIIRYTFVALEPIVIGESENVVRVYYQYNTPEPPVVTPPVTEPPVTEPPATEPPVTEPPATEPPATEPPATEPPATEPPATEPPATEPPHDPDPQNDDGLTDIPDDDVPLADVPQTGDPIALYAGLSALCGAGMVWLKKKEKEEEEEEEA